jgi:hypothetical protein
MIIFNIKLLSLYMQTVPIFEEEVEETDMDFDLLSPPGVISINENNDTDGADEIFIASEQILELKTDLQLNGLFGKRVNPRIYNYFSTFDDLNRRFVPYLDVFIKNGRFVERLSGADESSENRRYRVSRRATDVRLFSSVISNKSDAAINGSIAGIDTSSGSTLLASKLANEDAIAEQLLLELFVSLHSSLCSIQHDIENIEPLSDSAAFPDGTPLCFCFYESMS